MAIAVVERLKRWLKIPGNNTSSIAVAMNYKTSATIEQWVKRGRIPSYRVPQLLEIINGSAKPSNKR